VEPPDADRGGRGRRSGSLGHDTGRIPEPSVSFVADEPVKPSRDYLITVDSHIGEGSLRDKAQINLEAIRLLKHLEATGRDASIDEKHILARYTGWGAMPAAFDSYTGREDEWNDVRDILNELLTDDEHDAASASVTNAHYTSPLVVEAIWAGLEHIGVSSGTRILEPSVGVGNFLGLMPESLATRSLRTGVELDSITARIAKQLYPDATIFETGFEDAPFPNNFFDVAIGNVPFGNYGVHDPKYKNWQTTSIHDYFFIKSLDKLRPGGVLAYITSRYTMDKIDSSIRGHLASQADLLGAIRLPNSSFKGNAGTTVTTDILFLQKRGAGQVSTGASWVNVGDYASESGKFSLNEYYLAHPEMMLGEMRLVHSRYAAQPELIGEVTQDNLSMAISALPRGMYAPRAEQPIAPVVQTIDPNDDAFWIINWAIGKTGSSRLPILSRNLKRGFAA
jgi:hypothetical protein